MQKIYVNFRLEGQRLYTNGDGLSVVALKGAITSTLEITGLADEVTLTHETEEGVSGPCILPRLAICGCNHEYLWLRLVAA